MDAKHIKQMIEALMTKVERLEREAISIKARAARAPTHEYCENLERHCNGLEQTISDLREREAESDRSKSLFRDTYVAAMAEYKAETDHDIETCDCAGCVIGRMFAFLE